MALFYPDPDRPVPKEVMKTTRRDFIKMAIAAGFALTLEPMADILPALAQTPSKNPDIVAIKNSAPSKMFEAGIKELGGMSRFVKKGQIVVVKPNIGWAKTPEDGANTQPELVAAIVALCYREGAKKVYVFDNTCEFWRDCYAKSGIERAALDNNAIVVPANREKNYKTAALKSAAALKTVKAHELFMEADVVINVPVLKHHGGTQMSAALKNLMGAAWDRRAFHLNGLSECIAEFSNLRKPDLTVIDAYRVIAAHGPRGLSGRDTALEMSQLIGTDMVALDTAAAMILGYDPRKINHIAIAEKLGAGTMALDKLNIKKMADPL